MLILGRILVVLVAIILLLTAGAYLLPREVTVVRSTVIDAPPGDVFPQLNSLQNFHEWSPWSDLDPATVTTFSGPESGIGNRMQWTSDDPGVGSGTQEIVVSQPDEHVETELDFGELGLATAWWTLTPEGDATQVTWGLDADMGNAPVGRYMGLMMDRWVGPDYERGLARLKETVEGQ